MGFPGEELTAHEPLSEFERGRQAVLRQVAKLGSPIYWCDAQLKCAWCKAVLTEFITDDDYASRNYNEAHPDNGCLWFQAQAVIAADTTTPKEPA